MWLKRYQKGFPIGHEPLYPHAHISGFRLDAKIFSSTVTFKVVSRIYSVSNEKRQSDILVLGTS